MLGVMIQGATLNTTLSVKMGVSGTCCQNRRDCFVFPRFHNVTYNIYTYNVFTLGKNGTLIYFNGEKQCTNEIFYNVNNQ